MVFTDLDGTLIDHDTYDWRPAAPALEALRQVSAGLVLASSKTAAEMITLRAQLGAEAWPAIVENGAGVLPPFVRETQGASEYVVVRLALDKLAITLRRQFRGFGDVSAVEVAEMTGLSIEAAQLAKERQFSEPGIWSGSPPQKEMFLSALADAGITAQQGGRFLTLSLGHNKVDQMRKIVETYRPQHTLALGDAPNDVAVLEQADIGVVVANPARKPLATLRTEPEGRIIRTEEPGPQGWNLAVLSVIEQLKLK